MLRFHKKVQLLVEELRTVPEVKVLMPVGTFYVFPDVSAICKRLGIRRMGWRCFCWRRRTTSSVSPVWAANVSGQPGKGFCV